MKKKKTSEIIYTKKSRDGHKERRERERGKKRIYMRFLNDSMYEDGQGRKRIMSCEKKSE